MVCESVASVHRKARWVCPVCDKLARFETLVIDKLVRLNSLEEHNGCVCTHNNL